MAHPPLSAQRSTPFLFLHPPLNLNLCHPHCKLCLDPPLLIVTYPHPPILWKPTVPTRWCWKWWVLYLKYCILLIFDICSYLHLAHTKCISGSCGCFTVNKIRLRLKCTADLSSCRKNFCLISPYSVMWLPVTDHLVQERGVLRHQLHSDQDS